MKKLVVMALALLAIYGNAQESDERTKKRHDRAQQFKDMTPEEIATLKTKRMTLDLDLTDKQKDEIYQMNLNNAKTHRSKAEERKKLGQDGKQRTKEERFNGMNDRLDRQIEHKRKMRSVLNDNQYQKWERGRKRSGQKKKMRNRRRGKRH